MGYLSRQPNSNEPPKYSNNPWIQETELMDETALLISGAAKRCKECNRACRLNTLTMGYCPDCYLDRKI